MEWQPIETAQKDGSMGQEKYLAAAQVELAVCHHCQTWFRSECLAGLGCPTEDGVNGASFRTASRTE